MEPIYIEQPYIPPYFVYRVFSADNDLLYIGSTNCVQLRINYHWLQRAIWFPLADRVEVEQFDDQQDARDAEIAAIRSENPLGNIKYTSRDDGKMGRIDATLIAALDRLEPR